MFDTQALLNALFIQFFLENISDCYVDIIVLLSKLQISLLSPWFLDCAFFSSLNQRIVEIGNS